MIAASGGVRPAAAQERPAADLGAQPLQREGVVLGRTDMPSFFFQQTPTPSVRPALQNLPTPRRRASMVGYLDDPVVSSKVRVRYELGFQNVVPDRAEFFYAKCGCYRDLGAGHPELDLEAPGPRPGAANDINFRQTFVLGEYAAAERVSVFGELPIRSVLPQSFIPDTTPPGDDPFSDQTGIGDLRAGVKLALGSSDVYTATAQVKLFLPTGAADQGLGTDHVSIEPAVLYSGRIGERGMFEAQAGLWAPFGGADGLSDGEHEHFTGNVFFYGFGPSVEMVRTDRLRLAPVVELIGWHVLGGYGTGEGDASGTKIYNIKFGARVTIDDRASFYVGYGKALTDATWYDDILRFEYRHGF
jgi:hypothetical protein